MWEMVVAMELVLPPRVAIHPHLRPPQRHQRLLRLQALPRHRPLPRQMEHPEPDGFQAIEFERPEKRLSAKARVSGLSGSRLIRNSSIEFRVSFMPLSAFSPPIEIPRQTQFVSSSVSFFLDWPRWKSVLPT